ncbi:MAG: hypothetical protein J7497_08820 [Chitinophagaceae bacterium]|nr:hypothetical protein [Chitinophagaceae bacterium]
MNLKSFYPGYLALAMIILTACSETISKTDENKEPIEISIEKRIIPQDTLLHALQNAAVIVADSSKNTIPRLYSLFSSLSERFFIRLNIYDEVIDTAAVYVYLDSAFNAGSACILSITVLPNMLRSSFSLEDLETRLGDSYIEEDKYRKLIKEPLIPVVFSIRVKDSLSKGLIKVYTGSSLSNDKTRKFEINEIRICNN